VSGIIFVVGVVSGSGSELGIHKKTNGAAYCSLTDP